MMSLGQGHRIVSTQQLWKSLALKTGPARCCWANKPETEREEGSR